MRKSVLYSQNFLKSSKLIQDLLDKTSITKKDFVYEIGPGKGIITTELVKRCKKVIAIEIDKKLCEKLRKKFQQISNIEIHRENFLTYKLLRSEYKVFSNIPFNITSDVIRKLVNLKTAHTDVYLIVQHEAAKKFMGIPSETQFSVLIKPWFELEIVHQFKPSDFYPIPRVRIILLRIKKREAPLIVSTQAQMYRDFIVYSFSRFKPTLREGLKNILTSKQFQHLARDLKFKLSVTPTQISFNQWIGLFRYFRTDVETKKRQLVIGSEKKLEQRQKKIKKIHRTRLAKDWKR